MTRPLGELPLTELAGIRLLATDIDGTMTAGGRIPLGVLAAWQEARARGLLVLLTTGRSAGEALGLARYLPDAKWAVAENGAVLLIPDEPPLLLVPPRQDAQLLAVAARIGADTPLQLAADAFARQGDLAFERAGRSEVEVTGLRTRARAHGVHLIASSVHLHLSSHRPDKGAAVQKVARRLGIPATAIATIGDSHNDEGLWRPRRFAVTVGTADVAQLRLRHRPAWQTAGRGASGWCEWVDRWLAAQT